MGREAENRMVVGTYVGPVATVLESGQPVAPGDRITIEAEGADAHLIPQMSVEPDEAEASAKSSRTRTTQTQEKTS